MHSSKLLNSVDKNYIITHIEALVMTYALHKFRHYLLGNMFTFYVDHMVSMSHLIVDALNRLHNQIEHVGVSNQTCDVHLFTFQPKWL
jgi:hypothetical protein